MGEIKTLPYFKRTFLFFSIFLVNTLLMASPPRWGQFFLHPTQIVRILSLLTKTLTMLRIFQRKRYYFVSFIGQRKNHNITYGNGYQSVNTPYYPLIEATEQIKEDLGFDWVRVTNFIRVSKKAFKNQEKHTK